MRTKLLVAGLMAATLFNAPVFAEELTVLTLVAPDSPAAKIQADVIAAFEKSTGATVKLTTSTDQVPEVFETSTVGDKEADVVYVNLNEGSLDWVKNGIALPVNDLLDSWNLKGKISAGALAEWTGADGKVSGFPYSGFVWPVWFNTALLAKAGVTDVPKTTDDLIAAAGKLRAAGIGPVVVGGSDWSGQKLFLQVVQSFMSADETKAVYSSGKFCGSENAMKGIALFTQLRDAGVFIDDVEGFTADQMNATFFEAKAAIMPAGSWAFGNAPADMKIALGGFPVPAGGTYSKPTAYQGWTGPGFFISRNGERKLDLVKAYVSAWYDPAIVARNISEANSPTPVALEGEVNIANPLLKAASTDLPKSVDFAVMPDTSVPGSAANAVIRQTALAFDKSSDAQAICSGLESAYAQ